MANIKSAQKQHRKMIKNRARNRAAMAKLRTAVKTARAAVDGKTDKAKDLVKAAVSIVDGAVTEGHPQAQHRVALRLASRLAHRPHGVVSSSVPRFLTAAADKGLHDAIASIEAASSAEIEIAVRERARRIAAPAIVIGLAMGATMLALALFSETEFALWQVIVLPVVVGALGAALAHSGPIERVLGAAASSAATISARPRAPRSTSAACTRSTRRTGVLVFVALHERIVELVADTAALAAIGQDALDAFGDRGAAELPSGGAPQPPRSPRSRPTSRRCCRTRRARPTSSATTSSMSTSRAASASFAASRDALDPRHRARAVGDGERAPRRWPVVLRRSLVVVVEQQQRPPIPAAARTPAAPRTRRRRPIRAAARRHRPAAAASWARASSSRSS